MTPKEIQSRINLVKSRMTQLNDTNYFTTTQADRLKPAMQAELDALEQQLKIANGSSL